MNDKRYTNVYNGSFRETYRDDGKSTNTGGEHCEVFGQIRFRQSRKRSTARKLIKSIAIIMVASISGAAAGYYVVEQKYSDLNSKNSPQNIFAQLNADNTKIIQPPKNIITKVVENVGPAVVGISSKADNFSSRTIDQFTGSGIVIRQDGMIVTNYHIIENPDSIYVKLSGGDTTPVSAKLIKYDKASDLAVIKIDTTDLPVAKLADDSKVRIGDIVVAIGNPLGEEFAGTVTQGIVSAANKKIEVTDSITKASSAYKVLQTDASINISNSGGPLCNELGEVIAINDAKLGGSTNTQGVGVAISSNEIKRIIDDVLVGSKSTHPVLGVEGSYYEEKGVTGIYVREVYLGAAESGILPTDIILEVNGVKIKKVDEISEILEGFKVGDSVECKVLRYDKNINFTVQLKDN